MKSHLTNKLEGMRITFVLVLIATAALAFSIFNYNVFAIALIILATGSASFCRAVYYLYMNKLP